MIIRTAIAFSVIFALFIYVMATFAARLDAAWQLCPSVMTQTIDRCANTGGMER